MIEVGVILHRKYKQQDNNLKLQDYGKKCKRDSNRKTSVNVIRR